MRFSTPNIQNLAITLDKLQRYYAYKYEVLKENVGFVIKGHGINVMINGELKETTTPAGLQRLEIKETTGEVK